MSSLQKLRRGGHDPVKVYNAYKAAMVHQGSPTVILAQTIKGYGLGEAGEGRNITHQQKKLNEQELLQFRSRFGIPLSDDDAVKAPFYKPADNSEEMRYLLQTAERTWRISSRTKRNGQNLSRNPMIMCTKNCWKDRATEHLQPPWH